MWQGVNYKAGQGTKEIAKLIKNQLKEEFPSAKWSITTDYSKISISLLEYDKGVSTDDDMNVNHYNIERNKKLSNEGKLLFIRVRDIAQSYNYNDSDIMRDYFECGFYLDLNIGKWNKPFKVVKK